MPARRLMTLHAPMAKQTADALLRPAIDLMDKFGFRWWFDPTELPNLSLTIDCPQQWLERGPSQRELDHFFTLYDAGEVAAARKFAADGFPTHLR